MDQAKQNWYSSVNEHTQCTNYRMFKTDFGFEKYLNNLQPKHVTLLCKFRTRNLGLPVDRYFDKELDTKCKLCDSDSIGDEFHYVMECKSLIEERKNYITDKNLRKNTVNFARIMKCPYTGKLRKLCKFLEIVKIVLKWKYTYL